MAKLRVQVGKTWIEVECVSVKDGLQQLSEYMEVFAEGMCGICQSADVIPHHRTAQSRTDNRTFDFFEMVCLSCGAKLQFSENSITHQLYPKRKDRDREIGKGGWYQYQATQPDGDF